MADVPQEPSSNQEGTERASGSQSRGNPEKLRGLRYWYKNIVGRTSEPHGEPPPSSSAEGTANQSTTSDTASSSRLTRVFSLRRESGRSSTADIPQPNTRPRIGDLRESRQPTTNQQFETLRNEHHSINMLIMKYTTNHEIEHFQNECDRLYGNAKENANKNPKKEIGALDLIAYRRAVEDYSALLRRLPSGAPREPLPRYEPPTSADPTPSEEHTHDRT